MHFTRWSTLALMVALVPSPVTWPAGALALQQQVLAGEKPTELVLPTRRAPDAPPAQPPELPPLTGVTPLTLDVVIELQGSSGHESTFRRRVSRAVDRVHVAESDGVEWLFERNVRDPRRVSGLFVDHHEHVIVVYDESALRNTQGIRGWMDVLTLGFDLGLLTELEPNPTTRTVDGHRFVHYTARRKDVMVREVWWNAAQALPSDVVTARGAGSVRLRVEHVRPGVEAALLQAPSTRFPAYRVVELADYLERH